MLFTKEQIEKYNKQVDSEKRIKLIKSECEKGGMNSDDIEKATEVISKLLEE